ncbi:lactate utilization protein [Isachenkonia alkalipeptolytica]|uniref:Lactate utilization protein n=1 Tax=Isachenkonia alkalipeptolytica TaxID=2565777 RepID=A0AA44BEI3_9CLOT|nr:lactate utilization protein [Isachenkonia alkalipeptolytica]NBG88977.1 lactate utilization protein [Isachenkonia alkalipeptolytica]
MEKKFTRIIEKMSNNKIKAEYFASKEEAKERILQMIKPQMKIGIGGSMTIKEMEIYEAIDQSINPVYWHWMVKPEERPKIFPKAQYADLYLASTNALTEEGELINIDGVGNRVSAMILGPQKVILVCGVNKIVENYEAGIKRIKEVACPLNAKRLGLKTPCGITGKCNDCNSDQRMCNITVAIQAKPALIDLEVFIVGENLGY